jgi:hypothetical protein
VQTIVYILRGVCLTKHNFSSRTGGEKKKQNVKKDGDDLPSYCNQGNSQQSNVVPFIWISGKTKKEIKLTANAPSGMSV